MKKSITFNQLKRLIKESTLGIERNLAKVDRAVKKFNEFRKQALAKIGDEGSLYYETGSTLQSGPQYISEMHMEMDGEYVSINYVAEEMVGWNTRRVAQEDRANASDEFEIDNLLDSIKFLQNGVRKALKYYEKLNPDNEEQVLKDLEQDKVDEATPKTGTLSGCSPEIDKKIGAVMKDNRGWNNFYVDLAEWVNAQGGDLNCADLMNAFWEDRGVKYSEFQPWLIPDEEVTIDGVTVGGELADLPYDNIYNVEPKEWGRIMAIYTTFDEMRFFEWLEEYLGKDKLGEFLDGEIEKYGEKVNEGTDTPATDDLLISEFTAEWVASGLNNLDNMMDCMERGADSDKRKCWMRLGRRLREIADMCDENARRVWKR